ncbi:MAG: hypothetical protein ABWY33_11195 [Cellulomonas sp.]
MSHALLHCIGSTLVMVDGGTTEFREFLPSDVDRVGPWSRLLTVTQRGNASRR